MKDTVEISRETDQIFDRDTGQYSGGTREVAYAGIARVATAKILAGMSIAGDRKRIKSDHSLTIPAGTIADIRERDQVTVTSSVNPTMLHMTFTVIGEEIGTTSTSRRFEIELVAQP